MAKSLIINVVNGKSSFISVPTTEVNAQAFATDFLDGAFATYELAMTTAGNDVYTALDEVNVMFKNSASGLKSYATFYIEPSKTDDALFATLMGLTLNGVLIDQAYILSRRQAKRI